LPYLNTYFQVTDAAISPERLYAALFTLVLHGLGSTDAGTSPGQDNSSLSSTDS
jgi:hypothetical protein